MDERPGSPSIPQAVETAYTTAAIMEETLQAFPALREWVGNVELSYGGMATETEAMLVNVIVRQQNLISTLVAEYLVRARIDASGRRQEEG